MRLRWQPSRSDERLRIFISYAHEDEDMRQSLEDHLASRQVAVTPWHDRMILPGEPWDDRITQELARAHIILLLVSDAFLASDYCWGREVSHALQRHRASDVTVIPILVRPAANWHRTSIGALQALPKNAIPVVDWPDHTAAFADITAGICEAVAVRNAPFLRENKSSPAVAADDDAARTTDWQGRFLPKSRARLPWRLAVRQRSRTIIRERACPTMSVRHLQCVH